MHHELRVLLAHLKHVPELRILEEPSSPWVAHELGHSLGSKHGVTGRLLTALQSLLDLIVVWVELKALFVGLDGLISLTHAFKSHSFALEALAPVTFDRDTLFCILQSFLEIILVEVTR